MKFKVFFRLSVFFAFLIFLLAGASQAWAGSGATTTTLAISSGGGSVTTVASGTVVTLTATVIAGSTSVKTGQVSFCDASATYCTDIHILGTAQLTNAGTAIFKLRPGIGSHSYKAVFLGTNTDSGSASGASALGVTGKYPTATIIAATGNPGDYTLTATVASTDHFGRGCAYGDRFVPRHQFRKCGSWDRATGFGNHGSELSRFTDTGDW